MNNDQISLTDAAAERVRDFMAREGGIGLRVDVRRTGCSGWAYDVGIARDAEASDHVFEARGLKVVVSDKALPMVMGTEVDFVHEGLVREFRFRNPNVTGECGCGESFTVG
ncbi:HesB/IscA family protein [Wenzhouxiangella limi]|uniref:Iron-sulfur cluster assembly accessory protein n=1 Tax=Wenzhouxiangella limi TaxID=2707351 RepID=A0A845URV9_9GAMM|nr:iron-sulfur cluster assembly accessory protein [Wenzhouxiangella limi]NDY94573.1 iron-sulfur cluster assembly accessory protein [Wenzhouxiangella limi]